MACPVDLLTPRRRVSSASESGWSGRAASSETVATTRSVGGDVRAMVGSVAGAFEYCNPCAAHFDHAMMGGTASRRGGTMHELVIRGGTLVDGTGAPPRPADVAVDDGTITEVAVPGALDDAGARRTVDADGLLVTPGFVDIHTHYDGQVTWDPLLTPVVLARRHHRGDGQLRRRLRPGAPRPGGLAHRAHGGRRGHPRHRAQRGHHLGLGDLPRVPRRARFHAARRRRRHAGAARRGARVRDG